MSSQRFISQHRRLTPRLFMVVVSVFLLVVCWLGWMLVRQEAQLAQERRLNRLDAELTRASERLEREYQVLQQQLSTLRTTGLQPLWPTGVTLRISSEEVRYVPEGRLLYVPSVPTRPVDERLQRADRYEFTERNPDAARSTLAPLLDEQDPSLRAGALMRLARLDRKDGDLSQARARYEAITRLRGASLDAVPAPWIGWYGLCDLQRIQPDSTDGTCWTALARLLRSGRESVDAATYGFYRDLLSKAPHDEDLRLPPERDPLAEAVIELDEIRADALGGRRPESGFDLAQTDTSTIALIWKLVGDEMWALAVPRPQVMKRWLPSNRFTANLTLTSPGSEPKPLEQEGGLLAKAMTVTLGGARWRLLASETETMREASGDRRRQLILGFLIGGVILIAGVAMVLVSRALRHEFEVARLQSEFVAAVSHEFRTPLTSMRQLTEMLASGRIQSEERAQTYYSMLDREASRLARLVESLLNFGRMETGRFPYDMEVVDLSDFVRSVIDDFRREKNRDVQLSAEDTALLRMDADMVALALWNLLDNAAKYSDEDSPIAVSISRVDKMIRVAVTDRGEGVHASDRERIFDKFVRAQSASDTSVKGTGLGLTLVRRIMEDHGGYVQLEETSTTGSTFALTFTLNRDSNSDC